MTDKTKLLRMVEEAIERSPDNTEAMAQNVIDATADWFVIVLEQMGMQPSAIPSLLRWQAYHHEYTNFDWQETGDGV